MSRSRPDSPRWSRRSTSCAGPASASRHRSPTVTLKLSPAAPVARRAAPTAARAIAPPEVDRELDAPLPACCPDCGGEVDLERTDEQFQTELSEVRPVVTRFRVGVGRCRACRRRVQGRRAEQTSDALGAAASGARAPGQGAGAGPALRARPELREVLGVAGPLRRQRHRRGHLLVVGIHQHLPWSPPTTPSRPTSPPRRR